MVKAKHQKSKTNKQSHIKKHGKQGDMSEFRAQLDALGLKIIQVTADGNCFFRALGDQLEGNEEEHEKYRSMVKNRDMFEPFIEDDIPFDEYCESMGKDGMWAGHMELQAASLVTHCNLCIHRNMSPRWYIQNFNNREAQMLHLSYHDGEHYNSVRLKEDTSTGPARPIIIKADADLSATSHRAKVAATKSKGEGVKTVILAESVKLVMAGSGSEDAKKVEQVLQEVGGDIDAAIEFLIEEQGAEYLIGGKNLPSPTDISHGDNRNESYEQHNEEIKDGSATPEPSSDQERNHDKINSQQDAKKIPRNKDCPCGSKKKYKACCGAVSGRSSAKFAIKQAVDYGKSRKERKQSKKVGAANTVNSHGSEAVLPDVGALCI
ncbi:OVARIAN TUMOR DOMAIN-containing deubiquitinating enzyme 7-like isoform X2 [Actinidia eriantha]|uniref:OVARIAN TUMOR DOMAIN-containing deubiquitinating enzyme 7-like isoform X2 n=1 Tax=Actinidia eriantha TaxID=165200 RepID=UPI002582E65A|nr:OVARIAN TUMOR DOMAIN-containing deubiquitinating enzyme 7-like isoform X2 [Actinidia eriantha]